MGIDQIAYCLLLVAVGLERCVELVVSRRHQRLLAARGVAKIREPHFQWMVLLHAGVLLAAGLEVVLLQRPLIPVLAWTMGVLFVLATALRWWVIGSMSEHWNVEVMASARLGVVTRGPYHWVRHPNYVAVILELIALPLIHTAWVTAAVGTIANLWILHGRLEVEESALQAVPEYVAAMGSKPRFLPRLF
jgi:methyltransferase